MKEELHIEKSHNRSLLLYHFVIPIKYRRKVFTKSVTETFKKVCDEIGKRFEIYAIEVGTDKDHVHMIIQSVPTYSPTQIITIIKSITAKRIFKLHPEVKKQLWGGNFWTSGYYVNTVGYHGNFETIKRYVQDQGKEYDKFFRVQLKLF